MLSAPGNVDIQDALANGRVLLDDSSSRRVLMVFTPDYPQGRDFTWMDWAYEMRFSADGKQILFGGTLSTAVQCTAHFCATWMVHPRYDLGTANPEDLSADGAWAMSRLPVIPYQLSLLPTGTGEARQLTSNNIEHDSARWLPDGRIFATGNEPNHPERTFVIDMNGNEKPLTPEGIRAIAVTTDGKRLLTLDAQTSQYQLFPLDGGQPQPFPQLQDGDFPTDFTPDDSAILVRRRASDGGAEIWRVDLPSSKRTLLHTIAYPAVSSIGAGIQVSVSRDGKSYSYQFHPAISTEYLVEGLR